MLLHTSISNTVVSKHIIITHVLKPSLAVKLGVVDECNSVYLFAVHYLEFFVCMCTVFI